MPKMDLIEDLRRLINRYGWDDDLNMADTSIAYHIIASIDLLKRVITARDNFLDFKMLGDAASEIERSRELRRCLEGEYGSQNAQNKTKNTKRNRKNRAG